jgi:hypothetical protein
MFAKHVKCACVRKNLCWSCYVIIGLECDKNVTSNMPWMHDNSKN